MTVEERTDDTLKRSDKPTHISIGINISRELYRRMRVAANQNNLSLNDYIERILGEAVPGEASLTQREHRPITREAIERLRKIREEIMRDRGGKPFEQDSTELLREEREKRTRQLMGEDDDL